MSTSSRSILALLLLTTNITFTGFSPTPPQRAFKATVTRKIILEAGAAYGAATAAPAAAVTFWGWLFGTTTLATVNGVAITAAHVQGAVVGTALVGGAAIAGVNAITGSSEEVVKSTQAATLSAGNSTEARREPKKPKKIAVREYKQEQMAKESKKNDGPGGPPEQGPDGTFKYANGLTAYEREQASRRAYEAMLDKPTYKNGVISDNIKHHINSSGKVGPYVPRAQAALDNAVKVPGKDYLVGVHEGKWVKFQPDGIKINGVESFHPYEVVEYGLLDQEAKNALYRAGITQNITNGRLANWFRDFFFPSK